ncbi:MAG TPA: c-type cytochrome biogenesis protein CcsB [Marmoricola sp.]|jgi:cytochrome c-type biogenesis protein CcsB|nr:c-type cytochrome biogenesis protein CcsB [Marmoricola sp.]
MTHDQFEVLSNQAVAVCAFFYFVAVVLHVAEWAFARSVQPARVAVGPDGSPIAEPAPAGAGVVAGRGEQLARWGYVATVVAAGVHLVAVASRGLAADPVRVPWGNMYEFTLTATLVVTLGYLILQRRLDLNWLSPIVTGFVLVTLMVDVLLLYTPVVPLRDALQSPWLVIHVVAAIIATGAFTLGGMCSVLYLLKARWLDRHPQGDPARGGYLAKLPGLEQLDRLAYRTQAFAFPLWTFAALIAGPIWAQHAWGRYWGWDPKEIWAFITWVVYAAYLHARATAGWKGRQAAVIALIGLATLWFNFVGINFFFGSGSQHSYAAGVVAAVSQVHL